MAKNDKLTKTGQDLGSFFDGELVDDETEELRASIAADADMSEELRSYGLVRDEIKSLFNDASLDSDGSTREVDLWSRIAEEITGDETEVSPAYDSFAQRVKAIFGFQPQVVTQDSFWGLAQISGVLASVLFLFLYISNFGQQGILSNKISTTSDVLSLAKNTPQPSPGFVDESGVVASSSSSASREETARRLRARQWRELRLAKEKARLRAENQFVAASPNLATARRMLGDNHRSGIPPVTMASNLNQSKGTYDDNFSRRVRREKLHSPSRRNGKVSARSSRFKRSAELVLGDEQWIGSEDIPGGLRRGGVDIDWVKTDRPFKILNQNGEGSPIIWIGKSRFD